VRQSRLLGSNSASARPMSSAALSSASIRVCRGCLRSSQARAIGVQSGVSWPCGQNSRSEPECHQRRDLRHEAGGGGSLILPAGPVPCFYRRYTAVPGGRVPTSVNRRGFHTPPSDPAERREAKRMVGTRQSLAARRQGEVNRGRSSRRVPQAVDALRRLKAGEQKAPGPTRPGRLRANLVARARRRRATSREPPNTESDKAKEAGVPGVG
jgi:hypothetical protein